MLQGVHGLSVHESASACWARILAAEFRTPLWVILATPLMMMCSSKCYCFVLVYCIDLTQSQLINTALAAVYLWDLNTSSLIIFPYHLYQLLCGGERSLDLYTNLKPLAIS